MYVGVDYYPEHWPKDRWPIDADLMHKAGFNVVRMAEFAWVTMEPEEGRFDFAWLDEALNILAKRGIRAILGTPTGALPPWTLRKYPEIMAQKPDGQRLTWGMRKHNCFTSGVFRLLSERITRALAEHYKDHPAVLGWQTDNEIGGHPMCYCHSCRANFQDWCRNKYKTLAELNRAWGTHFWSQTFGDWSEIVPPDKFDEHNPHTCLDWKRFFSWLNVRFQKEQVDILRAVCPNHFITQNFMGLFSEINYYDLAEDLDFASWDNYPVGGKLDMANNYNAALAADITRGLKRKNFWIMEQTCGSHGWGTMSRNPRPGELRKISYQQLAHGADGQIWFRWRACTVGREQYWHGLLGHDAKPGRRYEEAARTAREYHLLDEHLANTTVRADVAILYDYETCWALQIQPAYEENKYHQVIARYYQALRRAGVSVDMIKPGQDLSPYKIVLAPDLYILPDTLARQLDAFVKTGGVLLADCRTAVKDETGLCHVRTLPGLLSDALGIRIEEYEALRGGVEYQVDGTAGLPGTFTAIHFADWIKPTTAQVLAGYKDWHMAPYAALTRNKHGQGGGFYLGTIVKEPSFYDALVRHLLDAAGITPEFTAPEGVEIAIREGAGKRILFLVNHTEQCQTVAVPSGKRDLLTNKTTGPSVDLPPYDVAVIRL